MDTANILGVHIALVRLEDVLTKIFQVIHGQSRAIITHTNVTGLLIADENPWYRELLNASDLVFCDGMGVILGARILGYHIPERFTLADWMHPLANLALNHGYSFYLLGNPPNVAAKAAHCLRERYPGISIAGTQHGYFDKTAGVLENELVIRQINASNPDILLVGFGMPLQEKWLFENWSELKVSVAITCGALFEYLSGELKRGPRWMTDHYLEWLARMVISPGRYWKRYLRDNPIFLYRVINQYFQNLHR